jgi:Icc protein
MTNQDSDHWSDSDSTAEGLSRREWMGRIAAGLLPVAGGLIGVGSMGAVSGAYAAPAPASDGRRRALRVAHLTDIHVKASAGAPDGMALALDHVHGLADRPALIIQGGDFIMDALAATAQRTQEQWTIAKRVMAEHCKLPVLHCIGNHDIWGYQKTKSETTGTEPLWGKKWALQELELEKPYYSVDKAGWHIIVLDTVQDRGDGGYRPYLDEAQWEWLEGDLAATPKDRPILIVGHVPFFSIGALLFIKDAEKDNQWKITSALMMLDARRFKNLALKHKNIRLCLAGHIHLHDRIEYNGVTYITTGAVSGNWWGGAFQETVEGYGLVDLYEDGTFEYQYQPTGWKVPPRPKPTAAPTTSTISL